MEKLYNKIIALKKDPNFAFLVETITFYSLLHNIIDHSTCPEQKQDSSLDIVSENCFFKKNGTVVYLPNYMWDHLYYMMVKGSDKMNFDFTKETQLKEFDIAHFTNKKIKPDPQSNILKTSVINLINTFKKEDNNNKKYYPVLQNIFNQPNIENILKTGIQSTIMKSNKNRKGDVLEMSMTKTAISLGEILILSIVQNNTLLKKFDKYFKSYTDDKYVDIPYIELLEKMLKAYTEKDEETLNKMIQRVNIPEITNATLLRIIARHLIQMLHIPFKRDLLVDVSLINLLSGINLTDLQNDLTKEYLQIGMMIITFLIDDKFFILKENIYHPNKKDKQHKIIVSENALIQIMNLHNINRPLLAKSNIDFILNFEKKNDLVMTNVYNNMTDIVRTHKELDLVIHKDCYLKKNKAFTLYTIDKTYLNFILDFIVKIKSINFSDIWDVRDDNALNMIKNLYTIYDIDLTFVLALENPNDEGLLKDIVMYSLDFNAFSSAKLLKCVKKHKTISNKASYYNVINKITHSKYTFLNALKETILYSSFKFFFNTYYLDSRGRFYSSSIFTNVQLYPLLKCLIKPSIPKYRDNNLKANFDSIKTQIVKVFYNKNLKKEMSEMDFNLYDTQKTLLTKNYIYNFFDSSKITREDFENYFADMILDDFTLLNDILSKIKKPKRMFYVHSMILLIRKQRSKNQMKKEKHLNYITNYYEVDATASGLQMSAMIFRDTNLATNCNLVGEKYMDVYKYATDFFANEQKILIEMWSNFIVDFGEEFPILVENSTVVKLEKSTTKEQEGEEEQKQELYMNSSSKKELLNNRKLRLQAFITMDFSKVSDIKPLFEELYNDFKQDILLNTKVENNDISFVWPFSSLENKFLELFKKSDRAKFCKYFLQLKHAGLFFNVLSQNPWINNLKVLQNRDLFKKQIMTYFYNATSYSRKDDFYDFLLDKNNAIERTQNNMLYFIKFLDHYFSYFMQKEMSTCIKLFKLSKDLADKNVPIKIYNKYFSITFHPTKVSALRVQTTSYKRNSRSHQITIKKYSRDFDSNLFRQKFSPNFIHSADALVVHLFNERLVNLNKDFEFLDFRINFGTNHDTFWLTMPPILKLILKDCYHEFYDSKYLSAIVGLNTSNYSEAFKDNPDFNTFNDAFMK